MQATTQTRLRLSEEAGTILQRFGELYGSLKGKLYARVAADGGKAMAYKTEFCRTHTIPARLFNALACDLQGMLDGTRELLKERRKDLNKALARQKKQLTTRRDRLQEVAKDRLRMAPACLHKLKRQAYTNTVAVARLESKLKEVETRLAANVPGICFGTGKLFRQQFHLALTSHGDRQAWEEAWRHARSHQVFFLGSKGETAGNQLCQLLPAGNGQFRLKIRLPDCLLGDGEDKYLLIDDVDFAYDRVAIERALAENVALSWRLHRDERGWRAFVAFSHPAAERSTLAVEHGAIGVDFNVDHLAVTETDLYGNMLRTLRLPLLREDATSGQREAVLSDALSRVVKLAKDAKKPLVAEDLDFSAKKKALGQASPKAARMLSGLHYAKYRQQLAAKCHRAGVELILIHPAYTSTIAAVKYAARRGWSVHAAAAGVIARRGQKLSERLPRAGTDVRVPVRGRHEVLRLPVRKDRRSRQGAWGEVHAAYRSLVREQWLAAGRASARPGVSTVGRSSPVSPSSKDHRSPCAILNVQICTSLQ